MKHTLICLLLVLFILRGATAQHSPQALIGSWKLVQSEALEKIMVSATYASMPEEQRKAFKAQSDLMMQVSRYDFKPDNKLVYMDVERSFVGAFLPVERNATWELTNDVLKIKETDRPYQKEMKIVSLQDNTLIVQLIIDGQISEGRVVFKSIP